MSTSASGRAGHCGGAVASLGSSWIPIVPGACELPRREGGGHQWAGRCVWTAAGWPPSTDDSEPYPGAVHSRRDKAGVGLSFVAIAATAVASFAFAGDQMWADARRSGSRSVTTVGQVFDAGSDPLRSEATGPSNSPPATGPSFTLTTPRAAPPAAQTRRKVAHCDLVLGVSGTVGPVPPWQPHRHGSASQSDVRGQRGRQFGDDTDGIGNSLVDCHRRACVPRSLGLGIIRRTHEWGEAKMLHD